MNWSWLPTYAPLLAHGLMITLIILVVSVVIGFLLAIPLALAQVTGPAYFSIPANIFCTVIRGTPLLVQLWLLYYGLGSLFPVIPGMREHFMWLIRLDAIYYALLAFSLSFAGYEAEVLRGGFLAVPRGELEAARAFGMTRLQVIRRVWLPRAFRIVLPTLTGETIGQLKSTPLVFTIPVLDLMGETSRIRQATYLTYEPLILLALIYVVLTYLLTRAFTYVEKMVPTRR